jgi:hypothetical protein
MHFTLCYWLKVSIIHSRMNWTLKCVDANGRLLQVDLRAELSGPTVFFLKDSSSVVSFEVTDKRGFPVTFNRISEQEWKVDPDRERNVIISYVLYCNTMSPHKSYVSGETWFICPDTVLLHDKERLDDPGCVIVSCPEGFDVLGPSFELDLEGQLIKATVNDLLKMPFMVAQRQKYFYKALAFVKGDFDLAEFEKQDLNLTDGETMVKHILFVAPSDIEPRALEFGTNTNGLVFCSVIKSKPLEELARDVQFIVERERFYKWHLEGFSRDPAMWALRRGFVFYVCWKALQQGKANMFESFLLRVFSMKREVQETLFDSSARRCERSVDRAFVMCYLYDTFLKQRQTELLLEDFSGGFEQFCEQIETRAGMRLDWLHNLTVRNVDLEPTFILCQTWSEYSIRKSKRGLVSVK